MSTEPKIRQEMKQTNKVVTSVLGKNEINAVLTPAITKANTMDK